MSKNKLMRLLKKQRSETRQLLNYRCPDVFLHGLTEEDIAFKKKRQNELEEVEFLIKQLKQFRNGNNLHNTGAE